MPGPEHPRIEPTQQQAGVARINLGQHRPFGGFLPPPNDKGERGSEEGIEQLRTAEFHRLRQSRPCLRCLPIAEQVRRPFGERPVGNLGSDRSRTVDVYVQPHIGRSQGRRPEGITGAKALDAVRAEDGSEQRQEPCQRNHAHLPVTPYTQRNGPGVDWPTALFSGSLPCGAWR